MSSRIKRPDVSIRDKKLDTLNVQLKKIDSELGLLRKQIDQHQVADATQKERKGLQEKTKDIIKTQAELKTRRNAIHDAIKQLDAQIRRRSTEVSEKLGKKAKYNSVAEIKTRLDQIEDSISSGELSLVEEKLLVKEMQSLNKLNKDLIAVEPIKKAIENDKAKIASLKEQLSELNPREVAAQFEETQSKLNAIQAKTQGVYDKRQALFTKRTALYKKRDEVYAQIRQIRSDFDNEFKAYKNKLEAERLKREEDQKLSKLLEEKDAAMGKLQEKLTHAKLPAFTFEIEAIENSLTVLDPTYVKPKKELFDDNTKDESFNVKHEVKPVQDDDLVPIEKDNKDDLFRQPVQSKSKKFKKKFKNKESSPAQSNSESGENAKFTLEPSLIATLAELDVLVPISQEDVATTIKQLKAKHEEFLSKQDEQTDANIAAVEKEISKLELDYSAKEEQIKKELEAKRAKEQQEKAEGNKEN